MDPVSLGIGITGLFGQVVQCFDYFYLARTFGPDYQTYQLRFDGARLRLSRWGAVMKWDSIAEGDRQHAENLLVQIYKLFERSQKMSAEYEKTHRRDKSASAADKSDGLDKITDILHEKMRDLSLGRSSASSPLKKAKWAIYTQEHMRNLTDDITGLTNQLIDLFPATTEEQKLRCDFEIAGFLESLRILHKAIEGQDKLLSEALVKILKPVDSTVEIQNNDNTTVGILGRYFNHTTQNMTVERRREGN